MYVILYIFDMNYIILYLLLLHDITLSWIKNYHQLHIIYCIYFKNISIYHNYNIIYYTCNILIINRDKNDKIGIPVSTFEYNMY